MSHRKRKHRQPSNTYNNQYDKPPSPLSTRPDPSLYIVAHEADILRGPQAARAADSLEVALNVDGKGGSRIGDGLIKWENGTGTDAEGPGMWVDRYDARLLLDAVLVPKLADSTASSTDAVHSTSHHYHNAPFRSDTPDGWSDLASDAEDTFFLTPDEAADLHRTKRLRHFDDLRNARLRALSPDPDDAPDADPWGDSDEEPDEQQMELIHRTAAHVVRATNDAQLRARILAHHGADPRFAFLRGRWGRAWARAQAEAHRDMLVEQEAQSAGALGGLTGYGSVSGSEEDDDDHGDGDGGDGSATEGVQVLEEAPGMGSLQETTQPEELALRAAQEARRAKAREWAEKRRAAKALSVTSTEPEKDDQETDIIPS